MFKTKAPYKRAEILTKVKTKRTLFWDLTPLISMKLLPPSSRFYSGYGFSRFLRHFGRPAYLTNFTV
jgi:hypothetical protein